MQVLCHLMDVLQPADHIYDDTAAIVATGLRKTYRETAALDGLDLRVNNGEVFALLGPNGAGKTTTIDILTGQLLGDAGEVRVLGIDPHKAGGGHRARVGVVAQGINDFDQLRVGEVVEHFASYYPSARTPDEVLGLVGLEPQRRAFVKTLSGGQRRRLDVAIGIVGRPDVIFLDEPTVGFDPAARRDFWALIRQLADEGTTILLTTHYLDEAEALADRVGVLVRGRLIEVATPCALGGGTTGLAVVRWRSAAGAYEQVTTAAPTQVVRELAGQFGDEIPELTVTRPSLEDRYLAMLEEHQ